MPTNRPSFRPPLPQTMSGPRLDIRVGFDISPASILEDVLGDPDNEHTASQNALVARICFLIALCWFRKVNWIVEQPQSSVMFTHPIMSKLFAEIANVRALVHLGAFSLESLKPIYLVGSAPWIANLTRTMTPTERLAMKRTVPSNQ